MPIAEKHTKVLIIGAGPSGLMMAAQLLRHGVQPVIIDSKQGPTNHSKALAVQARSLEIYRQMGVIDRVLEGGKQAKGVIFFNEGDKKAELSLANVGVGQTPFPFVHLFPQSKNEKLLLDILTQACCPVYWNTTLLSFKQSPEKIQAQLQSDDEQVTLTCDWLIGADGAHSTVRKQSQILFKGDTYAHNFYLADVKLNNPELQDDKVQLFLHRSGFAGFFPMTDEKTFRIVGSLPDELQGEEDIPIEKVNNFLNTVTRIPVNVVQNNWFTTYRLHHRMAERFRDQRCFLIGDAAHIHSPVGGQGMNTGLQDAYNLAWKLAYVSNGYLKENILNSYALERIPVAKELLSTTDRVFSFLMSGKWFTNLLKKFVLPNALKFLWSRSTLRAQFFKMLSQTGITYRHSRLNVHLSHAAKIKAGDRLPYVKIFDEKTKEETDLHAWCSKPGFTLIILAKLDEIFLFKLAKWLTQKYPSVINLFYLPPSGKNLDVFDSFEMKPNQRKVIIVRPDMYIGYINDVVDIPMMENYLKNVVGFK